MTMTVTVEDRLPVGVGGEQDLAGGHTSIRGQDGSDSRAACEESVTIGVEAKLSGARAFISAQCFLDRTPPFDVAGKPNTPEVDLVNPEGGISRGRLRRARVSAPGERSTARRQT